MQLYMIYFCKRKKRKNPEEALAPHLYRSAWCVCVCVYVCAYEWKSNYHTHACNYTAQQMVGLLHIVECISFCILHVHTSLSHPPHHFGLWLLSAVRFLPMAKSYAHTHTCKRNNCGGTPTCSCIPSLLYCITYYCMLHKNVI